VPIALSAQRAPEFSLPQRVSFKQLFAVSPLGVVGVVCSGAVTGTVFSLGPVYAAASGFDTAGVAAFMACSILPAVVVQMPVGRWSDRVDRRTVLVAMSLLGALTAGAAMLLESDANFVLFATAVAASGGVSLTTYALCVSHVNDHLRPEQMVAASGTVILLNGVGAVAGPLVVSSAMQATGPGAYFGTLGLLHVALGGYALWRRRRTQPVAARDKGRFVGAPPQAAPTGRLAVPGSAGQPLPIDR
jgi:MYXO-CTERM domain-containing protein